MHICESHIIVFSLFSLAGGNNSIGLDRRQVEKTEDGQYAGRVVDCAETAVNAYRLMYEMLLKREKVVNISGRVFDVSVSVLKITTILRQWMKSAVA